MVSQYDDHDLHFEKPFHYNSYRYNKCFHSERARGIPQICGLLYRGPVLVRDFLGVFQFIHKTNTTNAVLRKFQVTHDFAAR